MTVFNAFQTLAREPDPTPKSQYVDAEVPAAPPVDLQTAPEPLTRAHEPAIPPATAAFEASAKVASTVPAPQANAPVGSILDPSAPTPPATVSPPAQPIASESSPTANAGTVPGPPLPSPPPPPSPLLEPVLENVDVPPLAQVRPPSRGVAPREPVPAGASGPTDRPESDRLADEILSGSPPKRDAALEPLPLQTPVPRSRHTTLWALGCLLLLASLALQAAYLYRAEIAREWPESRPVLNELCTWAECKVPWPNDKRQLDLVVDEFRSSAATKNQFMVTATLKNRGPQLIEYPMLVIVLTNNSSQAVLRRRLQPPEYLGRALGPDELFQAGADLVIRLTLATEQPGVTGYELDVDYPAR